MQERKSMKKLYGIIFCISIFTSLEIDASWDFSRNFKNGTIAAACITTIVGVYIYCSIEQDQKEQGLLDQNEKELTDIIHEQQQNDTALPSEIQNQTDVEQDQQENELIDTTYEQQVIELQTEELINSVDEQQDNDIVLPNEVQNQTDVEQDQQENDTEVNC